MSDFASDLGSSVGSIFAGAGSVASAKAFKQASHYAGLMSAITEKGTATEEAQAKLEAQKVIGGQKADVAGAGFSASGSALDLLRSSESQASLRETLLGEQGLITSLGYKAQESVYAGEATSAKRTGYGQIASGVLNAVGSVASLFF